MTIQEEKRSRYVGRFLGYAEWIFSSVQTKSPLAESMKYSFFAGGKRIRPALMLAVTDMLGGDTEEVLPFAFALECIHTSSLIHDDLPALDNDTLRRGKPTNHVVFGEANAILAGNALTIKPNTNRVRKPKTVAVRLENAQWRKVAKVNKNVI